MKIPIVLICDDNYITPTSVAIASMISSKEPESSYEIYIVCASLTEESEAAFSVFASDSVGIHIIRENADRFASLHTFSATAMCVASVSALLKFVLPDLFPQYDKVIYLDGDILVRTDLSELYATDLEDNFVAAVMDSSVLYSKRKILSQVEHYFNSGVMVLNLAQMRLEGTVETLIQTKRESTDQSLMDQNVLNIVFDHRVKCLPIWYNFLAINLNRARDKWELEPLNQVYGTQFETREELFDSWKILHFSSKDKPWKNPFVLFADRWFDVYLSAPIAHTVPDYPGILASASVTVSLTSYPARIWCVPEVINCLWEQTVRPNRVALYLAEEQFPEGENELPERLLEQAKEGQVEIHWCDRDLRSHKKYFYAMQEFPDDVIITVDDDVLLRREAVEELLLSWLHNPNAVSGRRTHLITFDGEKNFRSYEKWITEFTGLIQVPCMQLIAIGCGGVLYPPHILPPETFDIDAIMANAPRADDLWLKANEAVNDIPVVCATTRSHLSYVPGSQDSALYLENKMNGGNNEQLRRLCEYMDGRLGGKDILHDKIYYSAVGTGIFGTEILTDHFMDIRDTVRKSNRKLREEKRRLTAELSDLERRQGQTKRQLNQAKKQLSQAKKQLNQAKKQLKASQKQNADIKRSVSYRLGRVLTWPVRKLKRLLKGLRKGKKQN